MHVGRPQRKELLSGNAVRVLLVENFMELSESVRTLLVENFMEPSDLILLFGSMRVLLVENFMEPSDLILMFGSVRMLLVENFMELSKSVRMLLEEEQLLMQACLRKLSQSTSGTTEMVKVFLLWTRTLSMLGRCSVPAWDVANVDNICNFVIYLLQLLTKQRSKQCLIWMMPCFVARM